MIQLTAEEASYQSLKDYTDYVTKSRVLPSLCLKPVHRRILWSLIKNNARSGVGRFIKTSSISGTCQKYHPHGTASVEGAVSTLVNSANSLVKGRGNWGSYLGTAPAAARYTEIKTSELFEELYDDSMMDVGDFIPSYDETDVEPLIIPTKLPLPLLIGLDGIGVGLSAKHFPVYVQDIIDDIECILNNEDHRKSYRPALECFRIHNSVYPEYKIVTIDNKEYINITKLPIGGNIGIIQNNQYIHELVCSKQIEVIDKTSKDGINIFIHAPQSLQQLVISSTAKALGMDLKYYWKRLRTSGYLEEWVKYRKQYVKNREHFKASKIFIKEFIETSLTVLNSMEINNSNFKSSVETACSLVHKHLIIPEEYRLILPPIEDLINMVMNKPISSIRKYETVITKLKVFTDEDIKNIILQEIKSININLFSERSKDNVEELTFAKFDKKIKKYIYFRPGSVIEVKASRIPRVLNYEVDSDSLILYNKDGTTESMPESFFGRLELGVNNNYVGFGSRGEVTVLVTESKKIVALTRTSVLKEPIVAAFPCKKIQIDGKDHIIHSGMNINYTDSYKVLES